MKTVVDEYLDSIRRRVAPGTFVQYRLCLDRFSTFLNINGLEYRKLEAFHLERFSQHLTANLKNLKKSRPVKPERVQRHLQVAGQFLHYLYRHQKMLRDLRFCLGPAPKEKPLPFVPRYNQVQHLLSLPDLTTPIGLRDRAVLETVYGCGLRLGELHRLAIKDVDLHSELLVVLRGKGGPGRYLPLGRCAGHYLERYLREARRQLAIGTFPELWISNRGRPFASTVSLQYTFLKYERQLDFPLSCHTLRHAYATHLLEGGANLRLVQQLLGHREMTTTQRYTQVRPTMLKQVHQRAHPRG